MDQAEIGKLYRLQTGETAKLLQKKPGGWKEFLIVSTSHANGTLGLQEGEILTSRVKEDALLELGPDGSAIRPVGSSGAGLASQADLADTSRSLPSSASLKRKAQMKSKSGSNFGLARRGGSSNGKHKGLGRRGSGSDLRSSKGYDGLRTSSPNIDTSGRSLQNLVDVCHHVMEIEDTPPATGTPATLASITGSTSSPSLNLSRSFDSMVTISSLNGLHTPSFGFSQPASPLLLAQTGGRVSASQSPTIPMLASPVFTPQGSPTQERQSRPATNGNSELMDVAMPDVSEEDILSVWTQQNASRVSLTELPNSVLFRILAYLPIQTLSRVEALSTTFRLLVGDVWHALIQRCSDGQPKALLHYHSSVRPAQAQPAMWKAAFLSEIVRWQCAHCGQVFSGATNRNGTCKATVWGAVPLYNNQTHARNPASVRRLAATPAADIAEPPLL